MLLSRLGTDYAPEVLILYSSSATFASIAFLCKPMRNPHPQLL
jgi:hypothetical protein